MALEATLPSFVDLIKEPFKKYVVGPVVRHITYPFRCRSKVQTLQDEVEKLNNMRLRLQQSMDDATRNGEEIFPDVTKWLTAAGKDIEDAEKLIQGKAEAMNKCFLGLCPNLKTRCQLSKKAHKKALAVGKQLQDAQAVPDPISFRPPPQQIVEPSVYSSEALPSRLLILNQIMDALKDPKLNIIGVYGMGGVGKTTLAKEVKGRALQEKMLFETVVKVDVSQTPDLRRIQGEIADSLGLKFDAEEVPGRASRLHQRLEKTKVLIILDDVWRKLDLNAVGVPNGDAYEGCKILLTSRKKEVLCNEMRTQRDFSLEVLKEEETWRLFEMSVSNITKPELATEIAKKCAGLPLLILKVAADLRDKESYAWSDMLNQLSSLENTEIYQIVHKVIESSYENLLDVEAKSLFLLCALFRDPNIPIRKLVMYCVGLGLFTRIDSIEAARNRVLKLIDKLKNECLLLDSDKSGFVKIHAVVRDIALVVASRVQQVFVGAGKVRSVDFQNRDCTRISLPYCDVTELPGVLDCPEAEVFSLFANDDRVDIPNSFLEGVKKVKVVDFTGVRFVSGLPSSLGFLRGLQTLCLQRCKFDNAAIVAELKQLEWLTFAGSHLEQLPREIKGLTRLKVLDLSGCYKLKVIPENVISNLSSLEELYISHSFDEWETGGNASLGELKNLSHLTTVEIQVKDDELLPEDWFFNGVKNYRISIGGWYWFEFETSTSRRILKLELKTTNLFGIGLMHRIKEFLRGTEVLDLCDVKGVENLLHDCGSYGELRTLRISKCDTLKSIFSHSFAKYSAQLQKLEVSSCGNMEAIAGEMVEFTQLTSLRMSNLPNLIGFCRTSGMISFPSLTRLEIYECNRLKYVFTNSMVKSLEQLKQLEIIKCESMEEILLSEDIEEQNINKIVFPKLDRLELKNLEVLKRFSSGHLIDFPSLRVMEIYKCRAFENLVSKFVNRTNKNESVDEYLFFNELVTFSNLEHLHISEIDKLKYVFHASCGLPQLQKLQINNCGAEVIFANAKNQTIEIDWPSLTHLQVSDCNSLISISANNSKVTFPNLEHIFIARMDKMKYVFPSSVAHGLLQLQKLEINKCGVDLIVENSKDETIEIEWPSLTHLKVWDCDNLIKFSSNNTKVTFPNLEQLYIAEMGKLKYVFPASVACGLLQLRKLEIRECGVEVIIADVDEETIEIEWPNLTHLEVFDCYKLINFGSNNSKLTFPKLKHLSIAGMDKLKYVFPASVACALLQLQKLEIKKCGVEVIIANAKEETVEIEWPNLTHLKVLDCNKLIKLSSNNSKLLPNVEVLELDHHSFAAIQSDELPVEFSWKLKRVILNSLSLQTKIFNKLFLSLDDEREIGDDEMKYHLTLEHLKLSCVSNLKHILMKDSRLSPVQHLQGLVVLACDDLMNIAPSSVIFQNLTSLKVEGCKKMTSLVTASTAKTMVQLMELRVSNCEMMIEIVAEDDVVGCTKHDVITFEKLKCLELINLGRLDSFCSGNYKFNFPLLEQATVGNCSRMKIFCSGILSTPKLHGIGIVHKRMQWEGDINATIFSQKREWVGEPILPTAMKLFKRLNKLIVRDCNWVEVLFNLEGLSVEGGHVGLLPKLIELELINLPKLTQLCNRAPRGLLDFNNLGVMKIENCSRLEYALTSSMSSSLSQLYSIEVKNCEMMETIMMEEDATANSKRSDKECPSLKMLTIRNCPSIKAFISRQTMTKPHINFSWKVFANLEKLFLDIKSISAILQFKLPANFFSKVKKLELGYVASSTTKLRDPLVHFLSMIFNLHRLEVCHSSVKELFKFQGLNIKFWTTLPRIRKLKLYNLDDMKQIWWRSSEFHVSLFQSLEILQVQSCGRMLSLASSSASFQNLKKLEVDGCNQLRYVMTSSVAKSMVQLEILKVDSCKMLMEIVGDGNDGTTDEIIFTKLKKLELSRLQSLSSFSLGHYAFQFPCLVNVTAHKCPNLGIFCPGIIVAPVLRYVSAPEKEYYEENYWKGDLNTTIEHIYKNLLVGFLRVEDVKLSMFPILKEKWEAQLPFENLCGLKRLEVDDCAQFTRAISSHLLPHLSNLEVLIVNKCNSVEQVFNLEEVAANQWLMKGLNKLQLIDLPRLRNVWSKDPHEILSFANLQLLNVQNCCSLTCIFNLSIASSLQNLQHLEVINCSLVEYIIAKGDDETMQQYQTIFPSLETMKLKYLTKLLSFYSTSGLLECPVLKFIEVVECPNMELSSSTFSKVQDSCSMTIEEREEKIGAQYVDSVVPLLGNMIVLPKLEELKVDWNNLMNYMKDNNLLLSRLWFIDITGFKDEYAVVPSNVLQNFPNLEKLTLSDASMEEMNLGELSIYNHKHNKLKLSNLPKLKHLVGDDSQLVPLFDILVELEVCECSTLRILVPSSVLFQNLVALEVSKCDGMKHLISASSARSLVQLRRMKVRDCENMQVIVAVASDEVEYEIRFSQLEHLELDDLPCLACFYSGNGVLYFLSLEEVLVKECPIMKTFAEKVENTPKLMKVKTGRREYEWEWEGSLNNTIHSLFTDKED